MRVAKYTILYPVIIAFDPCYGTLENGLIAYYPFNGNANDESGNGNDGTVSGPVLTVDRHGNVDGAFAFDGVDDRINCGNQIRIDQRSFTISAWTLRLDASSEDPIISQRNGGFSSGDSMSVIHRVLKEITEES